MAFYRHMIGRMMEALREDNHSPLHLLMKCGRLFRRLRSVAVFERIRRESRYAINVYRVGIYIPPPELLNEAGGWELVEVLEQILTEQDTPALEILETAGYLLALHGIFDQVLFEERYLSYLRDLALRGNLADN